MNEFTALKIRSLKAYDWEKGAYTMADKYNKKYTAYMFHVKLYNNKYYVIGILKEEAVMKKVEVVVVDAKKINGSYIAEEDTVRLKLNNYPATLTAASLNNNMLTGRVSTLASDRLVLDCSKPFKSELVTVQYAWITEAVILGEIL